MSEQKQTFDYMVTHRDPKSGAITHTTPYILRIVAQGDGGRMKLMERPPGSGNVFDAKGNPRGRWIRDEKTKKGKHVADAEHVQFVPPETQDQKIARSLVEKESRIMELEKELASIKKEKENKGKGA